MMQEILDTYLDVFPAEHNALQRLLAQIAAGEALNDRKNYRGHIAGDGMVLSPNRDQLLVIHHRVYDIWLQPGGHWDPEDANPMVAAEREVGEETGLQNYSLVEWLKDFPLVPLDIDTHPIPANEAKQEAAHFHHSFAYIFQATSLILRHQEEEVLGAKWISLQEATKLNNWHFPRVIQKLEKLDLI
jgi:8-oxo-dGTP pyrophosphatase MutT (NUDIX family)